MALAVYEDGEVVCSRAISCLPVRSPGCLMDKAEGEFDCVAVGRGLCFEQV
jgi:hypothetical protein